ncbi:hypothetical protein TTHERM_000578571 (macronuclear) [Tetrahymena thermophila SB210]|uniref:Uncharacterized protein n=1 Tax=Tetrahymena thermophila (strain SB210) TaxID=312017 RepID=W7X081_TETTS|nr:hypothetical protein TTHERM_000578571 [Tetrahymena thermophila SB210]EWS72510.1 hypothetical protein TTHERM_000578571 [Tetrahymena thermophila SB210]|eukprot:XP_012654946.1 hypothetical protein TTHERM_000578571 [Tetrahymena thermophila SB210]
MGQLYYKSDWSLILTQDNYYQINMLYYSNLTYFEIDTSQTAQIQIYKVKYNNDPSLNQILCLNLTSQQITFYQIYPYQKILAYSSSNIDQSTNLIPLNTFYNWIQYTINELNHLYLDPNEHTMSLLKSIQISDMIYSVFLIDINSIIIVSGTSQQNNLNLNLYSINASNNQIFYSEKHLINQPSSINQVYSFGDLIIICTTKSVGLYQISSKLSQLSLVEQFQQMNPSLCSSSNFDLDEIFPEIHIIQTIQQSLFLNIINTTTKQKIVQFIPQFQSPSQVMSYLQISQGEILFAELPEIQQICDLKCNGQLHFYDIFSKKIINSIKIWDLQNYDYNQYQNFGNNLLIRFSRNIFANKQYLVY